MNELLRYSIFDPSNPIRWETVRKSQNALKSDFYLFDCKTLSINRIYEIKYISNGYWFNVSIDSDTHTPSVEWQL